MKEYCVSNSLARGRTNHNVGNRVTYLTCNHDGCNAKTRLIKFLDRDSFVLETAVGFVHEHDIVNAPDRGLSDEQKRICLECYSRNQSAPKKVKFFLKYRKATNYYYKIKPII